MLVFVLMPPAITACVQQTAILPPGEAARYYLSSRPWLNSSTDPQNGGEEKDQISERVVTLTGSDIINDADGKAYDKAVAFTVANAPTSGYNNADVLVFNYGTDRRYGGNRRHAWRARSRGRRNIHP